MIRQIVNALGGGRGFVDPLVSPHVAHTMEVGAILDRDARCANIADKNPWFKDLDFSSGRDGAVDLAARHEGAG